MRQYAPYTIAAELDEDRSKIKARDPNSGVVTNMECEIVCEGCMSPYILGYVGGKLLCSECVRHANW